VSITLGVGVPQSVWLLVMGWMTGLIPDRDREFSFSHHIQMSSRLHPPYQPLGFDICSLFRDTVNNSDYVVSNDVMIVINALEMMQNEVVLA
jgi:hypothetical protein